MVSVTNILPGMSPSTQTTPADISQCLHQPQLSNLHIYITFLFSNIVDPIVADPIDKYNIWTSTHRRIERAVG